MSTRTITGNILKIDGSAYLTWAVEFILTDQLVTATDVYTRNWKYQVATASDGSFTANLPVPDTGTTEYLINIVDGRQVYVNLGAGPATDLQTLIEVSVSKGQQDALQTIMDAHVDNYHEFNVRAFGAIGNGTTDDSTAIQAAIDAASLVGGGIVVCPRATYKCNVVLKEGVYLVGDTRGVGYGYLDFVHSKFIPQTRFIAAASGVVVDTPVGLTLNCGVAGVNISGLGASVAGIGIRFRNVNWGSIKQVHVSEFADEGIRQDAGWACTFEDITVIGCLLNRTRLARTGAVDIGGTDHYLSRVEATASLSIEGTKTNANLYCCAVVIRGSTCRLSMVTGEISDIGLVLTGVAGWNALSNCRCDLNYGHGFVIESNFNMFSSCLAIRNSQDANNAYSGFYTAETTAQGNQLSACISSGLWSDAKKQKYGFEDAMAHPSPAYVTRYTACNGIDNVTGLYNMATWLGATPDFSTHPVMPVDGDLTPNVEGVTFLVLTNYTGSNLITNFLNGIAGQDLYIIGGYANSTTIEVNAHIYTSTLANKILSAASVYHFKYWYGVWYEQA